MPATSFNDGWMVGPQISPFAKLVGNGAPRQVTLPHDALIAAERSPTNSGKGAFFPSGAFEYTKSFYVSPEWRTKTVRIRFDGVYRDAMVFVNDAFAAQRPNGFVPFDVDLTPYLAFGTENRVRVEMRNHDDSRWYAGAGIYRDVRLDVRDLVHVEPGSLYVATHDVTADLATIDARAVVANRSNETRTVRVHFVVRDAGGAIVAHAEDPLTIPARATAAVRSRAYVDSPSLWSVASPYLYESTIQLLDADGSLVDDETATTGIRTLQLDPRNGLRVNGETVLLRGACIHHDNGLLGAAAFAAAETRKIAKLKDAGFNAVRSAHNVMSTAMVDACDRLGMLVMDEAFDMWTVQKSSFDGSITFSQWWERDLDAMVRRDRNHPSVVLYSIGNEIPETGNPHGAHLSRAMAERVRELDPTRYVTNSVNGFVSAIDDVVAMMTAEGTDGGSPEASGGVNDVMSASADGMNQFNASQLVTARTEEALAVLDVVGLNYGDARYELDAEQFPRRILVGSETYPTRIAANWALVERLPSVIGDFTWTGWDYLGEVGIGRPRWQGEALEAEAPYPWLTAWCGDLDITGFRLPASYYREIVFGLRSDPYIAVRDPAHRGRHQMTGSWSWSDVQGSWTWDVPAGTPMTVEVYSPGDEVELFVGDVSYGRRPLDSAQAHTAIFEVASAQHPLRAVAWRSGEQLGECVLASQVGPAALSVRAEVDEVVAAPGSLVYVAIELVDPAGTLVTHRDTEVSVDVRGPAVLQALGSARPDNEERFDGAEHSTFRGRLLAILRPTGEGVVTITAMAAGLSAAHDHVTVTS